MLSGKIMSGRSRCASSSALMPSLAKSSRKSCCSVWRRICRLAGSSSMSKRVGRGEVNSFMAWRILGQARIQVFDQLGQDQAGLSKVEHVDGFIKIIQGIGLPCAFQILTDHLQGRFVQLVEQDAAMQNVEMVQGNVWGMHHHVLRV